MSWDERGVAVAMSLGGRAVRIARSVPQAVLSQPNGLYILLNRLETYLGAELQDRVRNHARAFMRYRRPRGCSASDHILEFERLYAEAVSHGLYFNTVTLSMYLLDTCQLSRHQEEWVLQTVAADYSRYDEIRLALKRLPALDSHQEAFPANQSAPEHEPAYLNPEQGQHDPAQMRMNGLNHPLPEASPSDTHSQEAYPAGHPDAADEWEEESDDFVSDNASDLDSTTSLHFSTPGPHTGASYARRVLEKDVAAGQKAGRAVEARPSLSIQEGTSVMKFLRTGTRMIGCAALPARGAGRDTIATAGRARARAKEAVAEARLGAPSPRSSLLSLLLQLP